MHPPSLNTTMLRLINKAMVDKLRIDANKYIQSVSTESRRRSISGSVAVHRSAILGTLAKQALLAEAELTPKPGLVDRRGSGAHTDLSLAVMRRSAQAIEPFICRMASQSMNRQPSVRLRANLAATGRAAEYAMLRVTNGSNTHKGAIWTLGLLAAAAAADRDELPTTPSLRRDRVHDLVRSCSEGGPQRSDGGPLIRGRDAASRPNLDPISIARTAGLIASYEDPHQSGSLSHGQIVAQRFGVTGARGEAINGFPHIVELGLPMLRARRKANAPEPIARLDALLSIMAQLDDTCLLYRGGKVALEAANQGAAAVIDAGGAGSVRGQKCLFVLDKRLLDLGVSPGGSADLLAGTLFLDAIERQQTEIPASPVIRSVLPDEQKLVHPWSLTILERRLRAP
jgi:triphosphoribosyl-dephospho-CoA synthase